MYRAIIIIIIALALTGCGAAGQTKVQGDLAITLASEPSPPLAGRPATLNFSMRRDGAPLDGAGLTITRGMPGMEHPDDHIPLAARPLGDGRYAAQTSFVMGGRWNLDVTVSVANEQPRVVTFPIDVEQP